MRDLKDRDLEAHSADVCNARNRRCQFTIRTLLAVSTLVGVISSVVVCSLRDDKKYRPFDEIIETWGQRGEVVAEPEVEGPFHVWGRHYSGSSHVITVQRLAGREDFHPVEGYYYVSLSLENAEGKHTSAVFRHPVDEATQRDAQGHSRSEEGLDAERR